ncbi:MAG: DUF3365 domain-containing protein, partial [Proteobacteria bacterium]|nr:DUF3365 domain-containing protein [Pseudomonadota bacterium]
MKSIKSKLLISVGLIVCLFSAILLHRTYTLITANVENQTKEQLELALYFDLGIREYVAETLRPLTFNLVAQGAFLPETMSTSFVARNIFEKVRKKFPDYIIKFSADNPRNSVNQAGPEELNMIKYFNDNPLENIWTGEISMGGRRYFAKFSAMRMEKGCLHCHGDPADAPAQLLEIYGATAGFHLPLGKVVGLDTIAIPSEKISAKLWNETINNFAVTGVSLLLLCTALFFVFKFIITDRLSNITAHFLHAEEQDQAAQIESIEIGGRDEITILINSFNKLASRLNYSYTSLTAEIEERRQAQKALRESEKNYKLLLKNLPGIIFKGYKDWSVEFMDRKIQLLTGYDKED